MTAEWWKQAVVPDQRWMGLLAVPDRMVWDRPPGLDRIELDCPADSDQGWPVAVGPDQNWKLA